MLLVHRLAGLFRHHLANTSNGGGGATVVVDGRGAPVAAHSSQRPDSTAAPQVSVASNLLGCSKIFVKGCVSRLFCHFYLDGRVFLIGSEILSNFV